MVRHYGKFMNIPAIHFATLVEQMCKPSDKLSLKHAPAILGDKHHVIHETMERMTTSPEYRLEHTSIVSQWAEGIGLSPDLKVGACASDPSKDNSAAKHCSFLIVENG